jgi:alkanesulfonate monooxygenase SsuD/methylene tetrahydromethanopterin reductase-like flavin-dependent oxidoreductase (luciferase family)
MHLGLFLLGTGSHVAGWRIPGAMDSFQDIDRIVDVARLAEQGRFDLIFMGDNLYADPAAHPSYTLRFKPLTMLAATAMATRHIGLGATLATTYSDPWTTARAFARSYQQGPCRLERGDGREPAGRTEYRPDAPDPCGALRHRRRIHRRGDRAVGLLGG